MTSPSLLHSPADCPVWAVVVCFNGKEWIHQCLSSLQESQCPVQTVVLDNGSTDGSVALIEQAFPGVHLVRNATNLGFGQANNRGIRLALEGGAEWVFLLNQDAWVKPDALGTMLQTSRRHPDFGIISPVHLNAGKTALDYGFSTYIRADRCPGFVSDLYTGKLQSIYALPFVNAAAWLVTRKCLETVGGFDPLFFMYGEDIDVCHRAGYHRFKIGVVPHATICHARSNAPAAAARVPNTPMRRSERVKQEAIDLALLKNINRSFGLQIVTFGAQTVFWMFQQLAGGKWKRLLSLLRAKGNVVLRLPQLIRSRRQCKKPGAWFIRTRY